MTLLQPPITKWLLQFCFAITMLNQYAVAQHFEIPAPQGNLFDRLDLTVDGMEHVRRHLNASDTAAAEQALLHYFQTRERPVFPDLPLLFNQEQADYAAEQIITLRNATKRFGGKIDWTWEEEDKEWNFSLNRMDWLRAFAGVYQETGDERYARAWMEHVESWMDGAEHPGFPRTIDSGRRLRNWVISHFAFVSAKNSPSVTPEFNTLMLQSMYEQAEFLFRPESWRRYSNWGTFETSGFALFAVMFPEFKRHDAWMHEIWFRLRLQLEHSFHDDGMHIEVSPLYHNHELSAWHEFMWLADVNNFRSPLRSQIPIRPELELFELPAEALMYMYKPNGLLPQIGDTDDIDQRPFLYQLGELLDRPDMKYVASSAEAGEAPELRSRAFPTSGYYFMRSGWGEGARRFEDEHFLAFTTLSNYPWHAHYDILSIIVDAYGQELLKDPGRYTYNDDSPERALFQGTAAHNTILIDGTDQPRRYEPPKAEWYSNAGFDFVSGTYDGHEGVTHNRSVFFVLPEYWVVIDRLESSGDTHTYDQHWQLSEHALGAVTIDTERRAILSPHLALYSPFSEPDITVVDGWVSRVYREKTEAPKIRISLDSHENIVWPTIIYPFRDTAPDGVAMQMDGGSDAIVALQFSNEHGTDYYLERKADADHINTAGFESDARAIFLREDDRGEVVIAHVVNGTFLRWKGELLIGFDGSPGNISFLNDELHIDTPVLIRTDTTFEPRQIWINGQSGDPSRLSASENATEAGEYE